MDQTPRTWQILRISIVLTGLVVLFFSGLFPIENLIGLAPKESLTASIIPAKVATLTNQERVQDGLAPLSVNPLLTQAAQMKAEDMANNSYYAHVSPDGKTPLYWLKQVGYKYLNAGENLVIDRNTSEQAVSAWMNSADHRANILRPQFTEIGIGVAEGEYKGQKTIYVVQEFGTPYPTTVKKPSPARAPVAITPKPTPAKTLTLSGEALQKTKIISDVGAFASPISGPKKAGTPVPEVSSSTIATSSFSFTLAPEFFTPVTIEGTASATDPLASEQLSIPLRIQQYLQKLGKRLFGSP